MSEVEGSTLKWTLAFALSALGIYEISILDENIHIRKTILVTETVDDVDDVDHTLTIV